jgi:hypothetical protein
LGYPRSGLSRSDFVLWRKADIAIDPRNAGKPVLVLID